MVIDPKLHYCQCGCSWTPGTYHKIVMLLRGDYVRRCPQCGTIMRFVLVNHVVKVETKTIKDRDRVYRNG